MIPDGTSPDAIVLAVLGVIVVFCLLTVGYFWYRSPETFTRFFEWIGARSVNNNVENRTDVMSRSPIKDAPFVPSPLQTDSRQTADRQQWPKLARDEMLDICKVLRLRGFSREDARQLFRAFHQPLDNNLWTQAAPPDDDEYITPIAGRRTSAKYFEDDPELVYRPPS